MWPHRSRRQFVARSLALSVVALTVATTSCAASDDTTEVATLTDSGGGGATSTTTGTVDDGEALLAFAQCMRDNGVDMEDPTFDADGNLAGGFIRGAADSGIDPGSDQFQGAMDACGELIEGVQLGGPGGGAFDRTAIQDGLNAYTACLRAEGLEVDDIALPEPGQGPADGAASNDSDAADGPGGGGFVGQRPADGAGPGGNGARSEGFDPTERMVAQLGLDADDPVVAAAIDACQTTLDEAFTAATADVDSSTTSAP